MVVESKKQKEKLTDLFSSHLSPSAHENKSKINPSHLGQV
jgi:hypothetical protein